MTVTAFPGQKRGMSPTADDLPIDLAALAAKVGVDGVPPELLDGYLQTLVEVSVSGRPPREDELRRWRDVGARAAELGVSMRGLINLYLSATTVAWPSLPGVRGFDAGVRVAAGRGVDPAYG